MSSTVASCDPRADRYADVIEQQGVPIVVRRPSQGTYNASTRSNVQGPPVLEVETFGAIEAFQAREITDTSIEIGDLRVTVPAASLGFKLAPGDEIVYDSDTWKVLVVEPQPIGGTIAAYRAQIRK